LSLIKITLDTDVESLAQDHPEAVGFLTKQGIRCIRCGEPVWGTLGVLLKEEGVDDPDDLIQKLNAYLNRGE
jgi:hypothetical protein